VQLRITSRGENGRRYREQENAQGTEFSSHESWWWEEEVSQERVLIAR